MRRRGKILMYHGWGDPGANPIRSIRYREAVVDFLDDRRGHGHGHGHGHGKGKHRHDGERLTDSFLKLYLVPGMAHCGGGVGHSTVDWLSPLVNWVENGVAPGAIVGSRTVSGATSTRPHCPYPQEAVYQGGDANSAGSYACLTLD
jgi:feruloyl esterase